MKPALPLLIPLLAACQMAAPAPEAMLPDVDILPAGPVRPFQCNDGTTLVSAAVMTGVNLSINGAAPVFLPQTLVTPEGYVHEAGGLGWVFDVDGHGRFATLAQGQTLDDETGVHCTQQPA